MKYQRRGRIQEEIKKQISQIIKNELKDPRISPLTSIMGVEVTNDLRYATIFISVYGSEEDRENTLQALMNASGFIRKEIGKNLKIRYTPELIFKLDLSIEHGIYISDLIDKINKGKSTENEEDE